MAIEFLGHSPSFQLWVFKIDGKQFIGRNFSSASPLAIKFIGMYPDNSPISAGLVKTSGFDILSGTSQSVAGGIGGIVEWVWSGKKYRNTYYFNIGDTAEDEESTLQFAQPIPYDGPVGGPLAPPVGQTPPPVGSPSSVSYPGPSGTGTTPPVVQTPPPPGSPSSVSYPGPSGTGTTPPVVQTPPVTRPKFTEVTYTPYAGPSGAQGASAEKKPNLVPVVLGIAYLLLQ